MPDYSGTSDPAALWDKLNAPILARQEEQGRTLLFAVSLGLLAWGIAKHNTYVAIVGGGFLAWGLLKGKI